MPRWAVRLSEPAERDFAENIAYTADNFGPRQAKVYQSTLKMTLNALREGPRVRGSVPLERIVPGLRSLHFTRTKRRGRHLVLYREASGHVIEVVRTLHDAMEVQRHVATED